MTKLSELRERFPLLKWFLQAERIPLLFSVTIVAGIFYHYAPSLTLLWIVLSLLLQAPLFRLFDYMKKHSFLGGIIYCAVGAVFLALAVMFVLLGRDAPIFAPEMGSLQIDFMVWFMTPQSVLPTTYLGYTIALFLLFTIFIASVAYYFTLVRYRVLMSFVVMIFPFAIYAKENENMPVPSIIILLICYFAVMVYCRQAHGEDPAVVQHYEPDAESRLSMPSKKSPHFGVLPEFLDKSFIRATGIFIAASIILVLVIPKPEVQADRTVFDAMIDMSALSDYLMNAISGFADNSDGGNYSSPTYNRSLYRVRADEDLNLRVQTLTNYHYDTDSWSATDYDQMIEPDELYFVQHDGFQSASNEPDPAELLTLIQQTAAADPALAEKWDLKLIAQMPQSYDSLYHHMLAESVVKNVYAYPAPNHVTAAKLIVSEARTRDLYQNHSEILYKYTPGRAGERFTVTYLSPEFRETLPVQELLTKFDAARWEAFLPELERSAENAGLDTNVITYASISLKRAQRYAASVESHTPREVRQLAESLTAGLNSDYEKADAICKYLKYSGEFHYSLDYPITSDDNVRTFLFQNKTGVCYQFASAMAELCRAAGLPTRYVEGYAMSQPDERLIGGSEWDYVITTEHAHGFVDVYIPGYGWMMMDATAPDLMQTAQTKGNLLSTLQYSGLILFCIALVLLLVVFKLLPLIREKLFRKKCRKLRNAEAVQAMFGRLRKQWRAAPAETARALCARQGAFLQTDLSDLLAGFEQAVYADRCTAEAADRAYDCYCRAYDAYKPAVRRARKAARAARKQRAAVSAAK